MIISAVEKLLDCAFNAVCSRSEWSGGRKVAADAVNFTDDN